MRLTNKLQHRCILLVGGAIFPLGLAPFDIWPAVMISMAILFQSLTHTTIYEKRFFKYVADIIVLVLFVSTS